MKPDLTRREFVTGAVTAGAVTALSAIPGIARANGSSLVGAPELVVPAALPEKVFSTERVGIKKATHDAHLKLWQGYARKTNEIRKTLAETAADPTKANQIFSAIRELKVEYSFAYQGYLNHEIYFNTLGGKGGAADGRIAELIKESYGTFDNWAADWRSTGIAARGWVFLAYDHAEKRVFNYLGDAQNTFPIWNHTCVLAMDVYEHAYFMDFAERRAAYIDAYMQVIDWAEVNKRLP